MAAMIGAVSCGAGLGLAEERQSGQGAYQMEEVTVTAPADEGPFLADVRGAAIFAGKKTTVVDLEERPTIVNNNYRQALTETPGLVVSEETTPLVSIGYRGLPPDRAQFTQVLKDGVPITADIFGYPEAYYTPPLQSVERIEFTSGGAALLYGPQPGGALNFVTKTPPSDTPARVYTEHSLGSHQLYSMYTSVGGTVDPLGYLGYLHEREGNGFRDTNSDFQVISGGLNTVTGRISGGTLTLAMDQYLEEHGEPGGLTKAVADSEGRDRVTRFNDRFRLERSYGTLRYERPLGEDSALDLKTFGGHYRRWSKRQNGGGFGTVAAGSTNAIQEQDFYTFGIEPRVRHTYDAFGTAGQAVTAGFLAYFSDSPREDQTGSFPSADSGTLTNRSDRSMQYVSLFAEHLFRFGDVSITPGVRLEHIWQHVKERVNTSKPAAALGDADEFDFVPLFGVGTAYNLAPDIELYSNLSQGYRPKLFAQAVPTGATQVVNGDLEEGKSWTFDLGVRGQPGGLVVWDANYFLMRFEDQIGTSGNTLENVGDALHQGVEFGFSADLVSLWDRGQEAPRAPRIGSLSPYVSLMLLDARFTEGPQDGKTPQYAPQYTVRTGVQYAWQDQVTVRLDSTFLDDHFGDDANTAVQTIPSYKVWDLSAEARVWGEYLTIFGGVNNLFDERYYARVTSAGIDPAAERNIYGGVRVGVSF